jgi:hypothetical protein
MNGAKYEKKNKDRFDGLSTYEYGINLNTVGLYIPDFILEEKSNIEQLNIEYPEIYQKLKNNKYIVNYTRSDHQSYVLEREVNFIYQNSINRMIILNIGTKSEADKIITKLMEVLIPPRHNFKAIRQNNIITLSKYFNIFDSQIEIELLFTDRLIHHDLLINLIAGSYKIAGCTGDSSLGKK